MATVYLGTDVKLGAGWRSAAGARTRAYLGSDRFQRKSCSPPAFHPHIVPLFEADEAMACCST